MESEIESISCSTLPEPITEISLANTTYKSIALKLDKNQQIQKDDTFLKYIVNTTIINNNSSKIFLSKKSFNGYEIIINGLDEGTWYEFQVQTQTNHGFSRYSQAFVANTKTHESSKRSSLENQIVLHSFVLENE